MLFFASIAMAPGAPGVVTIAVSLPVKKLVLCKTMRHGTAAIPAPTEGLPIAVVNIVAAAGTEAVNIITHKVAGAAFLNRFPLTDRLELRNIPEMIDKIRVDQITIDLINLDTVNAVEQGVIWEEG